MNIQNDPNSFKEAVKGDSANKWIDVMNDKLNLINKNDVWERQIYHLKEMLFDVNRYSRRNSKQMKVLINTRLG